jgi:hypothetical protein
MKTGLLGIALLLSAQFASAAIRYEFRQSTRSDVVSNPSSEITGRAVIDGDRYRVDFTGGYPPGLYVISTNGSRSLTFVDSTKKSYTQFNTAGMAQKIGSSNISVTNLKSQVDKLTDHPVMAGLPTDHYRVSISYDITVSFGSLPLTQTVRETIDKWTTDHFGDVSSIFLANGNTVKTGNAQLDSIIDSETLKVKGFALRQVTELSTTSHNPVVRSELKVNQTRKQTREMVITLIEPTTAHPALFTVPASYRPSDESQPHDGRTDQVQMLNMDETTKQ